jgi:polyisoprenoid-binding protein YceI
MKFLFLFLALLSSTAFTQENIWLINKDHSEINFSAPYMKVAKISGRFVRFKGRGVFDQNEKLIQVKMIIDADSIFTGNSLRDSHLKQADFFNTAQFPQITFESDNIVKSAEGAVAIGDLTIRNVTKKVSFKLKQFEKGKDTWGKESMFVSFTGDIDRSEFNLSWNKTVEGGDIVVGNLISIEGVFQMQPKGGQTPTSRYKISDNKFLREREQLARGEIALEDVEKIDKISTDPTLSTVVASPAGPTTVLPTASVDEMPAPVAIEKSEIYYTSFFILALAGFIGSLLMAIAVKKWILDRVRKKYNEVNIWGLFGDFCAILVMTIYAISVYLVALN